jgi:hypothetical protein
VCKLDKPDTGLDRRVAGRQARTSLHHLHCSPAFASGLYLAEVRAQWRRDCLFARTLKYRFAGHNGPVGPCLHLNDSTSFSSHHHQLSHNGHGHRDRRRIWRHRVYVSPLPLIASPCSLTRSLRDHHRGHGSAVPVHRGRARQPPTRAATSQRPRAQQGRGLPHSHFQHQGLDTQDDSPRRACGDQGDCDLPRAQDPGE